MHFVQQKVYKTITILKYFRTQDCVQKYAKNKLLLATLMVIGLLYSYLKSRKVWNLESCINKVPKFHVITWSRKIFWTRAKGHEKAHLGVFGPWRARSKDRTSNPGPWRARAKGQTFQKMSALSPLLISFERNYTLTSYLWTVPWNTRLNLSRTLLLRETGQSNTRYAIIRTCPTDKKK